MLPLVSTIPSWRNSIFDPFVPIESIEYVISINSILHARDRIDRICNFDTRHSIRSDRMDRICNSGVKSNKIKFPRFPRTRFPLQILNICDCRGGSEPEFDPGADRTDRICNFDTRSNGCNFDIEIRYRNYIGLRDVMPICNFDM